MEKEKMIAVQQKNQGRKFEGMEGMGGGKLLVGTPEANGGVARED